MPSSMATVILRSGKLKQQRGIEAVDKFADAKDVELLERMAMSDRELLAGVRLDACANLRPHRSQ